MCQAEISKYLIKNKRKKVDIIELMANIPSNRTNLSRACRKMEKYHELKIDKVKKGQYTKFLFSII